MADFVEGKRYARNMIRADLFSRQGKLAQFKQKKKFGNSGKDYIRVPDRRAPGGLVRIWQSVGAPLEPSEKQKPNFSRLIAPSLPVPACDSTSGEATGRDVGTESR